MSSSGTLTQDLCISTLLVFLALPVGWAIWRMKWQSRDTKQPLPSIAFNFLPRSMQNFMFAFDAVRVLQTGYKKAMIHSLLSSCAALTLSQFTDQAFRVARADADIVVLPISLLEELARLPASVASPHEALEKDLLGGYTGLDLILDSRMHHSVVQRKLTPRLGRLTPVLEEELRSAVDEYLPHYTAWTEIKPFRVLAQVVARLSSRVLVGEEFCKDPVWLDVSINYTEDLFKTIVLLRLFPSWSHSVVCRLLPSYWRGRRHVQNAKALLCPSLAQLLRQNEAGEWSPGDDLKDSTVLHWLADAAKGDDRDASLLAQIEVLLALASVHTTSLRLVNTLYDLIEHPEYQLDVRAEISELHASQAGWPVTSYNRLRKLDSILRESQRMSPPTTLGLKRLFKSDYTFQNGLHVSAGTYVCLPTFAIENDPQNTLDPDRFDGMRSYRTRQHLDTLLGKDKDTGEEAAFHSFDGTSLSFGYGRHACPGRYFASLMLKMILVNMLTRYDFSFLAGSGRPGNYTLHEFLFCSPWQKILIKLRSDQAGSSCPF